MSAIFSRVTALSAIFCVVTAPSKILSVFTAPTAILGSGYVPSRSPPAGPLGGVVTFGASFFCVIEPSGIFRIIASGFTVGFGYVPNKSPPAGPQGNAETLGSNFDWVTAPLRMLIVWTPSSPTFKAHIAVSASIAYNEYGTAVSLVLGKGEELPIFTSR